MTDGPLIDWPWILAHLDEVGVRLVEHVYLSAVAVVVGFAISFPVAIYAYRHRRVYGPVASVAGILYTIPSLALFVLLVPVTGLTVLTAEIGLVSYTLLILIRNIVTGLDDVPDDAREAARAMGFNPSQLLWRVELPLAIPAIVAGVRIAVVTTIGLVTVTALIGLGGLGYFIVDLGIGRLDTTATLVGAVLSIALAFVADALLLLLQRRLTRWRRGGRPEVFV